MMKNRLQSVICRIKIWKMDLSFLYLPGVLEDSVYGVPVERLRWLMKQPSWYLAHLCPRLRRRIWPAREVIRSVVTGPWAPESGKAGSMSYVRIQPFLRDFRCQTPVCQIVLLPFDHNCSNHRNYNCCNRRSIIIWCFFIKSNWQRSNVLV